MKCAVRFLAVLVTGLLLALPAYAEAPASNEALFERGVEALKAGDHGRAINVFESLADRGFNHPDVTYDRGMAYLARVRAKQGRPGDLGRAAAAFEETLQARPGDEGAVKALELIRAEVARRGPRSSGQQIEMEVRPSLDRIIVGLAPEAVWAWLALTFSLVLAVGLVLRRFKQSARHLAGTIATPIGFFGLLLFAALSARARHVRHTMHPAVVVATSARPLDAEGAAIPTEDPIPEAARVEILERKDQLALVRHGQRELWTHASSLRELGGVQR